VVALWKTDNLLLSKMSATFRYPRGAGFKRTFLPVWREIIIAQAFNERAATDLEDGDRNG
jgi:hypothetical protein